MSLPPDTGPPDTEPLAKPRKVPGWKQPWDPGRKLMVAGCVVILGLTIAQAATDFGLPRWLDIVARFTGYGLLIVGFTLMMRAKRERRLAKERVSPPGPG